MNTLASLLRETFPRALGQGAEAVAEALQVRCPRCGGAGCFPAPAPAAPSLVEALELILPMAKGYAYDHQVGSNIEYVLMAEAALRSAKGE